MTFSRQKQLGQNFLTNSNAIQKIVSFFTDEFKKTPANQVLEIGPGLGAISMPLLDAIDADIVFVEKDSGLIEKLKEKIGSRPGVKMICDDFLELDSEKWLGTSSISVISNLPYSAATVILEKLVEFPEKIRFMILMFQKEVAARIGAEPGNRDCGPLTLFVQNQWEVKPLLELGPEDFTPAPKVDSTVLLFHPLKNPRIPGLTRTSIPKQVIMKSFTKRRKMLRSIFSKNKNILEAFENSNIDVTKRPENVSWDEWTNFFKYLRAMTLLICLGFQVSAHVGDTYGLGSKAGALGGSSAVLIDDPYAAYSNPAKLSVGKSKYLELGWGYLHMQPSFDAIDSVVIENSFNSDLSGSQTKSAEVSTNYTATSGQAIGIVAHPSDSVYRMSFGLAVFAPSDRLGSFDTGEPMAPEYVLHRARTRRPQFELGTGFRITDQLSLGLAAHIVFSVTTKVNSFLATSSSKTSQMRVASSYKPKAAPVIGSYYVWDKSASGVLASGLVVRFPVSSNGFLVNETRGEFFSGAGAPEVNFDSSSTFFYDPLTIEAAIEIPLPAKRRLFLQLDYQKWGSFQKPALGIEKNSGGIGIQNSKYPDAEFRSIFIPRVGFESTFGYWIGRLGYFYKPSIIANGTARNANMVDPGKHAVGLGTGIRFAEFFGVNLSWDLDIHGSYQWLESSKVTKSENTDIGSPGYTTGGKIYGAGVSMSMML